MLRTTLMALVIVVALVAAPSPAAARAPQAAVGPVAAAASPPDHVLVDLQPGAFYERAVRWLHGEGHTTGVAPGWFAPDRGITRAELFTLLWRMADRPPAAPSGFPDVPRDVFYTRAVDWAAAEGLTTGWGRTGLFHPDGAVDRAQMVTLLWRMADEPGAPRTTLADVPARSFYTRAVNWAHHTGRTTGVGDTGLFMPFAALTRGQAATFLWRDAGGPRPLAPVLPDYTSSVSGVDPAQIPHSWRAGCPVHHSDLRLVTLRHVGFDGRPHTGRLVVHREAVETIVAAFEHMYEARFPVQRVTLVDEVGGDDDAAMAANLTTAFNCRAVTNGSSWSEHAYGWAIDINPLQNPYVRGGQVLPPGGAAYLDRGSFAVGLITEDSAPVQAFDYWSWGWGGRWRTLLDYQHFSATDR